MVKIFKRLLLIFTCIVSQAKANEFIGTWQLVSGEYLNDKGKRVNYKSLNLRSIKVISKTHFSFVTMAGDKFWSSDAGRYRVTDNQYIETALHTSYSAPKGKEYVFTFKIEDDIWYSSRMENGVRVEYEVWHRTID